MYLQKFDISLLNLDSIILNYARPNNFDLIKKIKALGINVFILDTEGGVVSKNGADSVNNLPKNIKSLGINIHPVVFFSSILIILSIVISTLLNLSQAAQIFEAIQSFIINKVSWFYILTVNIILGFSIYLIFSKYGKICIGGGKEKPDYTYWSWFSMLFSAGMGIGLVFYSVEEPIFHYIVPPYGEGS